MADIIQIRRDTAANWTAANPILAQGEFGVETDTLKLKIGDGASPWTGLRYYHSGSPYEAGEGISINDFTINNTGIITIGTGGANGTIKANGQDIAVKGLGSAAFVDTTTLPNKDLSNLTSAGKNIGNWSSNLTNCITEIPQDIKLELNNGALTLKAGSKVYVPNGAGNFDVRTTANNMSATFSTNGTYLVGFSFSFGNITAYLSTVSGGTEPTTLTNGLTWYDTTNNVIKRAWAGEWQSSLFSLPICIATVSGGQITSIDQVFNGFGYIGSTVFALPGTTQLIPNRFYADGTLNNTKLTANTVQIRTLTAVTVSNAVLAARFNAGTPFGIGGDAKYDESRNINTSSGVDWNYGFIGTISISSGKITSFTTKPVFHAVDYNDTEFIAHQATPSNRYVDLTLPADGGSITSPADGYFYLSKNSTATGQRVRLFNYTNSMCVALWSSGTQNLEVCLPVSKGDVVRTVYSADGTTNAFRFLYANGSK